MSESSGPDEAVRKELEQQLKSAFAAKVARIGLGALLLSSVFLLVAAFLDENRSITGGDWILALSLMIARTAGIAAFMSGVGMIFFERWTAGTLLIITATVLPCLAFFLFGTV